MNAHLNNCLLTRSTAAGRNSRREVFRNDGLGRMGQPLWNCIIAEQHRLPAVELAHFTGTDEDFTRADGTQVASDAMGFSGH